MAMKRAVLISCVLMATAERGGCASPAEPDHAAGQDCAAIARARRQLRPDATQRRTPARRFRTGTTTGQRPEPLGDKLARSDGVLCPPAGVDPEMHAPAPDAGKTPVIPPPGSPGGDPTIRPK